MKRAKWVALLLMCLASISESKGNDMSSELNIYTGDDKLAPYDFKIQSTVLGTVNPVIYGLLLTTTETQEILPGIIKSWDYNFHENTYKLKLGNEKFHNGREVEAEDLEFSIVRGFISSSENYNRVHFSGIKGISALKVGDKFKSGMVSGIKVLDHKTLQIELAEKNPFFLLNFTLPFVPLVPKEELKDDYFTWKKWPVGAGPYKIEKDYADHRLVLQAVTEMPGHPVRITIDNARKMDQYDLIFDEVTPSPKEGDFKKAISKYPNSIVVLKFYRNNTLNKNADFRKAIYHAIDRDTLIGDSDQYLPAYEMKVNSYDGRKAKNPYDIELARSFAKKVPHDLLKHGVLVGVYASSSAFPANVARRINNLSAQFERVGINVRFEANPEKFPTKEVVQKFSMKMSSKIVDLADPVVTYGAMSPYHDENPDSDGAFDRAYEKALQIEDTELRYAAIQDIAKLIEDQALMVPLLEKYTLYRFNQSKLQSLGVQPKPQFLDLTKVELAHK